MCEEAASERERYKGVNEKDRETSQKTDGMCFLCSQRKKMSEKGKGERGCVVWWGRSGGQWGFAVHFGLWPVSISTHLL